MNLEESVRRGVLKADPALSRFKPLDRIRFYDDVDGGLSGWTELLGNYFTSLDDIVDFKRDYRPPTLSSATMWDTGMAGAHRGTYSMTIATRPEAGHLAKALKRITWQKKGRLRCEGFFTYGPDATTFRLDEEQFHAFGVSYDLHDESVRYWPAIRYLNAENGEIVGKWQIHAGGTGLPHLDGWEDIPDGRQLLCYNEILTKQNRHDLRWDVDLECNERSWDLLGKAHAPMPRVPNLWCLLNLDFWVETDRARRCYLYVDSVLLSTEE